MWKGHFIFHSTLVLSHFSTFMECDFLTPLQMDPWVGSMDPSILFSSVSGANLAYVLLTWYVKMWYLIFFTTLYLIYLQIGM